MTKVAEGEIIRKEELMDDLVSFSYFVKEILNNNEGITLLTLDSISTKIEYSLFDSWKDNIYKREYFFIDKQKLHYICNKNKIVVYKTELGYLVNVGYNKELKEKIENLSYFKIKYCITSINRAIKDNYESIKILNSLESTSSVYPEDKLNNMIEGILKRLYEKNENIKTNEKIIYESIKRKILTNRKFTLEEKELLNEFLEREEISIDRSNTVLKRSLGK